MSEANPDSQGLQESPGPQTMQLQHDERSESGLPLPLVAFGGSRANVVDDRSIGKCGGITQVTTFGDVSEEATHDLA